jgi:hypothetical protein
MDFAIALIIGHGRVRVSTARSLGENSLIVGHARLLTEISSGIGSHEVGACLSNCEVGVLSKTVANTIDSVGVEARLVGEEDADSVVASANGSVATGEVGVDIALLYGIVASASAVFGNCEVKATISGGRVSPEDRNEGSTCGLHTGNGGSDKLNTKNSPTSGNLTAGDIAYECTVASLIPGGLIEVFSPSTLSGDKTGGIVVTIAIGTVTIVGEDTMVTSPDTGGTLLTSHIGNSAVVDSVAECIEST